MRMYAWKWGTLLFLGCVAFLGFASNAQAQSTFSFAERTPTTFQTQSQAAQIKLPMLGDSRLSNSNTPTLNLGLGNLDLGILKQSFAVNSGALTALLVISGIVAIGVIVCIIGNIVALASGGGRLGWGVAGIVLGALGVVGAIINFAAISGANSSDLIGTSVAGLFLYTGLLVMGILNVVWHRRRRRRRFDRYSYQPEFSITPWANIDKDQKLQGGLALIGRF